MCELKFGKFTPIRTWELSEVRSEKMKNEICKSTNDVHISLSKMPDFELEFMYRTIMSSVRHLMQDPAMRADFEKWRKNRMAHQTTMLNTG